MTSSPGARQAAAADDREPAAPEPASTRRLQDLRRGVQLATVVTLLATVAVARWFVWPSTGPPREADAVVVLSGDHGERLRAARRLIGSGYTRVLVLVGEPDSHEADALCQGRPDSMEVVCLRPDPDSTRAEAIATHELAEGRGWDRVIVSTTTYHVARSRLHFRRCGATEVQVLGARPPYGVRTTVLAVAHEVLGFLHASTLDRRCRPG